MNHSIRGNILLGKLDEKAHEITITQVKHIPTESVLSLEKTTDLYKHIQSHHTTDGMAVTINDGWPIYLTENEVQQLKQDLEEILNQLEDGQKL